MSIGGDGYGERDRTGRRDPAHDQDRLTTRTRLPEGEGDTRPSPRPGKSLVTVVGVVVLLVAAIAFANRSGGETENTADGKDAGGAPDPQATAATGKQPVENPDGGIPSGFPHTKQGAESAAANYAVALGSADMFDKNKREKILERIIVPTERDRFSSTLNRAYSPQFFQSLGLKKDGNAPKDYTFISRTSPIGTNSTKYSDDRATVAVWCSGLLGLAGEGSTKPVQDDWFTITFKLAWDEGDWKAVDHKQKDGPAPVSGDSRAAGPDEIADAVHGYGGFTYAR